MNEKILDILKKEAKKRNQVMREVKMEDGTIYYTCGELNVKRLAKTAVALAIES
ncbi:hypothetical protein ACQKMI_10765 [Lysinibacillus sp. NPDC097214]|uniref:hypothetical protein n=1 Tax=Lysinibacillus sp. NPDC097214 TaxID=3390584 RepID=UPI003CFFBC66